MHELRYFTKAGDLKREGKGDLFKKEAIWHWLKITYIMSRNHVKKKKKNRSVMSFRAPSTGLPLKSNQPKQIIGRSKLQCSCPRQINKEEHL